MTLPGHDIRRWASRVFSPLVMVRVIEPMLADLQLEYARAHDAGRRWLARWIRIAGYVTCLRVVALYGTTSALKVVREPCAEDLRLACNTGVTGLAPITSKTRVNSGDLAFVVTRPAGASRMTAAEALAGTTVRIDGRGFGHGVGMCQYCARSMAVRGDGWQAMLQRFYPGAEIVKGYR